ncbi:MAG: outer membrane protein assembly factor BamE [Betaproteobacteria bacterium]|jgi:outer membrane protein assembly factor BamE|nr:outer membrane protein assembly factor BamE [Betaproteobacteria bacterium]
MLRASSAVLALVCVPLLTGCGVPRALGIAPYRIEVQQGNFISQEMVSQLKEGMSKDQVRQIMGTPLLVDIFHAERWDYIYSRETSDGKREKRRLAVFFADGKLARVDGDAAPAPTSAAGR